MSVSISAALIKELRQRTAAGVLECHKALQESAGDIEKALRSLREKGIASAAKKADRLASEGALGLKSDGKTAVLVELNCETDFVARTEPFLKMLLQLAEQAWADAEIGEPRQAAQAGAPQSPAHAGLTRSQAAQKLLQQPSTSEPGQTVEEQIQALISVLGENIVLSRIARLDAPQGLLGTYLHPDRKLGALVALRCPHPDSEKIQKLARDLAIQVAGHLPPAQALSRDQIHPDLVAREREIALAQARATGKPETMLAKIAEGKLSKMLQEITLLEQPFLKDPSLKVRELLEQAGQSVCVEAFVRLKVGEAA